MKLRQIAIIESDEHLDYTNINPEIQGKLRKYKPHFQQWGIIEIKKGENPQSVIDAIEYYQSKIKDNRFQEILSKLTPAPKNILTLNLDQLKTAQSQYDEKYNKTSRRGLRKQLKQNYTEVLLDTPQWGITKIEKTDETDGAAKILSEYARGTKWCVTDTKIGDRYLTKGPLYVIFKDGVKWALCHIESQQLMNVLDDEVTLNVRNYEALSPYIPKIGLFADKNSDVYRETIKKIPKLAYEYARDIILGRWPEAEPYIMKDPKYTYEYAKYIINGRWSEAEPHIMQFSGPAGEMYMILYISHIIQDRWPEAEPIIVKNPSLAYSYAGNVIRGRWPEAEPIIMRDPEMAYHYAKDIIKGRWSEAEPYIIRDVIYAYNYAFRVIERRWPEAEPIIMKNPRAAAVYARDVIQGRWPEAEPIIMQDRAAELIYTN